MNDRIRKFIRPDVIALGACAVVTGAGVMLGVAPTLQSAQADDDLRQTVDTADNRSDELKASIKEQRRLLDEAKRELANSEKIPLRPASRLNEHLARVAMICEDAGLSVRSLTPDAIVEDTGRRHIPITLVTDGQFGGIASLLARLHADLPDTGLRRLTLTGAAPGRGDEPDDAVVQLVWFVAPEDQD